MQEVHQVYNDWLSQVVRVYAEENIAELEWMVGPIPIGRYLCKKLFEKKVFLLKFLCKSIPNLGYLNIYIYLNINLSKVTGAKKS